MSNYSEFIKSMKAKDLKFFFGEYQMVSNKYFTFNHVIDDDNIIIITNNIKTIKDSYCLIVDNNKAVFLKDWQVRPVSNYWNDMYCYAVKLNRKYFKTYTFSSNFDNFCFEKEDTFDSLKAVAETQTDKIRIGH